MDDKEEIPTVHRINGEIVLDNPSALIQMRALKKKKCLGTLKENIERVNDFILQMKSPLISSEEVCIIIISADDCNGKDVVEALMPNHDWQPYRDKGQIPYARGIVNRQGIESVLNIIDKGAAKKLQDLSGIAIVIIDHESTEVFGTKDLLDDFSK